MRKRHSWLQQYAPSLTARDLGLVVVSRCLVFVRGQHCKRHVLRAAGAREVAARINMKLRSVIGGASAGTLDDEVARASSLKTGYEWALRMYIVAQREIRYQGGV